MGDLEPGVAVVRFLPADGLEGPSEMNDGGLNLGKLTTCCSINTISELCQ